MCWRCWMYTRTRVLAVVRCAPRNIPYAARSGGFSKVWNSSVRSDSTGSLRRPRNPRHGRPSEMGTPDVPSSRAIWAAKRCGIPDGLLGAAWADAVRARSSIIRRSEMT